MSEQAKPINDLESPRPNLDEAVEAFETIWTRDGEASPEDFLPNSDHPDYEKIALELLCVDLERRWKAGHRKTVEEYVHDFPDLFADRRGLERLAFEEFRMLILSGAQACPADFARRLNISTELWPVAGKLQQSESVAREAFAEGIVDEMQRISGVTRALPEVGEMFLDFKIVRLLGECRFGKVYLASQNDLANRLVVIKVTTNLWSESERLAKLQHTNVVPIYSVHQRDGLQAVCMPYLGRVTLHDLIRQLTEHPRPTGATFVELLQRQIEDDGEGPGTPMPEQLSIYLAKLSYEELCVWIMACVTGGLAHAHERGILHRDLKPANILITDAGQPMILDFNLSEDVIAGGRSSLLIGGTLPYMAPEHLRAAVAHGKVDVRSDIYALGVMLFQLLTWRLPTPMQDGSIIGNLSLLIQERSSGTPGVRAWNPRLSLAVESIVQKCLAFDPAKRYQSARELQEDLDGHLHHRVLKHAHNRSLRERVSKWAKRHPHISSGVGVLTCCLCVGVVAVTLLLRDRNRAVSRFEQFESMALVARVPLSIATADDSLVEQALDDAERALSLYPLEPALHSDSNFRWLDETRRAQLAKSIQQLNYLRAGALLQQAPRLADPGQQRQILERAMRYNGDAIEVRDASPAILLQRAMLERQLGHQVAADDYERQAQELPLRDTLDRTLMALDAIRADEYADAMKMLKELQRELPRDFLVWFLLGTCHYAADQFAEAETCFSSCIALWPDYDGSYFYRGASRLKAKRFAAAERDFSHFLGRRPPQVDALVNRALARIELGQLSEAANDLTQVIDLGGDDSTYYLLRSKVWKRLGDVEQAEADRQQGILRVPTSVEGWIERGLARLPSDPERALNDFEQALECQPRSRKALQNLAFVQTQLKRYQDAIQTLSDLAALRPGDAAPLAARGMLHAQLGSREAAREDAHRALKHDPSPANQFLVARILAQASTARPEDAREAVVLLGQAVRRDSALSRMVLGDPLLEPLRGRPDFQELVRAISVLEQVPITQTSRVPGVSE